MKKLFWILTLVAITACRNDKGEAGERTGSEGTQISAETDGSPAPAENGQVQAREPGSAPAAAPGRSLQEPIVGTRPVQAPTQFAGRLRLNSEEVSAATGENVCMKIMVGDFQEVITMQYSVRWDPAVLSFTGLKDLSLPYLTQNNFGLHRTAEGILTFVWIDNSLKGVNLPDGSTIYQVCFDVKGTTGQSSPFRISGDPTALESVNAEEKLLEIVPGEGKVTVR